MISLCKFSYAEPVCCQDCADGSLCHRRVCQQAAYLPIHPSLYFPDLQVTQNLQSACTSLTRQHLLQEMVITLSIENATEGAPFDAILECRNAVTYALLPRN